MEKNNCIYKITINTNEAGKKEVDKICKKLNTSPSQLLDSIITHGISVLSENLNSKDCLKYARPIYSSEVATESPLKSNNASEGKPEPQDPQSSLIEPMEVPGLTNYKF